MVASHCSTATTTDTFLIKIFVCKMNSVMCSVYDYFKYQYYYIENDICCNRLKKYQKPAKKFFNDNCVFAFPLHLAFGLIYDYF